MSRARATGFGLVCVLIISACGDGTHMTPTTPTPPTPTPPAAGTNQAPQILRTTVTPTLGVMDLTTFTAHVDAQDADGDRLKYTWFTPFQATIGPDAPD